MSKKLKSLEAFNKERLDRYRKATDPSPRPNGIACPECGKELYDQRPLELYNKLMDGPFQTVVKCDCGFRGERYA